MNVTQINLSLGSDSCYTLNTHGFFFVFVIFEIVIIFIFIVFHPLITKVNLLILLYINISEGVKVSF